jgi:hypothetical protein
MPDPIVGVVDSISDNSPVTVETESTHGLVDGEEIKVSGLDGDEALTGTLYAKTAGRMKIGLYLDKRCTTPVPAASGRDRRVYIYRPRAEDHAILVGINHYPAFQPPEFRLLKGPEIDALAFRRWLLAANGGRLPTDNVTVILSSHEATCVSDARPTLEQVHNAFRIHSTKAFGRRGHRVGRRLYIFLSGHGITPTRAATPIMDDAALLMANADDRDLQHLPGLSYAEWFRTAGAFDEILLFADCCRDQKNNVVPVSPTFPSLYGDRNRVKVFYAAATGFNATAWERDFGDPPVRRGIFSFALMEILERRDVLGENGQLTAETLMRYLRNRVQELKAEQTPRFVHDASPDIVLCERSATEQPNLQIRILSVPPGLSVKLIGPKYPEEETVFQSAAEPISLRLRVGLYKLVAENGLTRNFEVSAGSGQNVVF